MQPLPVFAKRKRSSLHSRYSFFILAVIGFITFSLISLGGIPRQTAQAFEVARGQTEAAANWQYASFPVENFVAYTSPFGYRTSPTNGTRQFHRGLDIAGPEGSYIRNWWGGQVANLSDNTACGTMITIQSGQWQHIYCHLKGYVETNGGQRYLVDRAGGIILQLGQQVPTGTRIGRIGMTGRTTGPHLHWGLKYGGNYIDPADVLREMHKQKTALRN